MPRKATGERPLTPAERQARQRQRKASQDEARRVAWVRVLNAKTIAEARRIAAEVLSNCGSSRQTVQ